MQRIPQRLLFQFRGVPNSVKPSPNAGCRGSDLETKNLQIKRFGFGLAVK